MQAETSLIDKIKKDQMECRKNKDTVNATFLTTLIGEIVMVGKNKGNRDTTDDEAMKVIEKFAKGVKESISYVEKQNTPDKVEALKAELSLYEKYLPKQLDADELKTIVTDLISELNVDSMKGMGLIMKEMNAKYSGQFDGKAVNGIIRNALS